MGVAGMGDGGETGPDTLVHTFGVSLCMGYSSISRTTAGL